MSQASSCGSCCTEEPTIVTVPGTEGTAGADGAAGADGVSAFTVTAGSAGPFNKGDSVTFTVAATTMFFVNQIIAVEDVNSSNTTPGYFQITALGANSISSTYLNISANSDAATILSGKAVSPSGPPFTPGSLPTAFTDNSGGTASNTIAAGVGMTTLVFYMDAATIANGDLLTDYILGYNFKILSFDVRCAKAVTTGAKAATLNLEIGTTNLTGGVVSLSGTYALGSAQAGTSITADNIGTSGQAFSIEASGVTAFTEGAFWLIIKIQNTDTQDAIASFAAHDNTLITALS